MKILIKKFNFLRFVLLITVTGLLSFTVYANNNYNDIVISLSNIINKTTLTDREFCDFLDRESDFYISRDDDFLDRKELIKKSEGRISYIFLDEKMFFYFKDFINDIVISHQNINKDSEISKSYHYEGVDYCLKLTVIPENNSITIQVNTEDKYIEDFGRPESSYMYYFKLINGNAVLYKTNSAG
jgi:hypothetical protein